VAETRTRATAAGGSAADGRTGDPGRRGRGHLRGAAPTWLPTGRAVLGGVLVVTAATGVLVAHRAASEPPTTRFVVVTGDVAAGHPVAASDLGTIAAEVPAGVEVVRGEDADDLVGRVARVPLRSMDLLRPDDLYEAGRFTTTETTEVELDLPPGRALAGTLQVGDLVDVLSTDPDRSGTTTVAAGVPVSAVVDGDGTGIGTTGTVRVRIGLPDAVTAEAVVDAAVRSEVTLALPSPAMADPGGAG
jgi:hypothetical protein